MAVVPRSQLDLAPRAARPLALLLMLASGFAGLGYQIVWTQQGALWLGHEAAAVLAVVTAFFGGLALGAAWLGTRIERSTRPLRWYAACEAVIAVWAAVLSVALGPAISWVGQLAGPQPAVLWQWGLSFGAMFVLLLPATAAMGATLPAMERVVGRLQAAAGPARSPVASLYAANTIGAMVGVLATAFWLVPTWGLLRTTAVCAVLNLACAIGALALSKGKAMPSATAPGAPATAAASHWRLHTLLAATGALGIGYEVLVVRVLSQLNENTVYTFAMLLAVYLVGTAAGAAAWHRWGSGEQDADAGLASAKLLAAVALSCAIGTASLWAGPDLRAAIAQAAGPGMAGALAAESALALAAFALPTFVMGALFSQLAARSRSASAGLSRALAVNTLGAAAAPLIFGVAALPALGAKTALLGVATGYVVLAAACVWRASETVLGGMGRAWGGTAVAMAAVAGLAMLTPPLIFVTVPEGGRVISYREGPMAAVSVIADGDGVLRLFIDNRQQEGSSASGLADSRQALLPRLLHPAPRHALFLGLGTGVTARAAAADPALEVEAAELLPGVIEASALFREADPSAGTAAPDRLRALAADARRFVRNATSRYDLIVSDNFHPARSGSGSLYTVEHFRAVRERLTAQGVFCQWLPLHQLDMASLRSIVRSFLAVYPQGAALLATNSLQTPVLGLVARADDRRFEAAPLRAALQSLLARPQPDSFAQRVAEAGIADEFALLGSFVAGPHALTAFAADAALNTDDRPVVAYLAPRITYVPDSPPVERLLTLLDALTLEPTEVFDIAASDDTVARLTAYAQARRAFLHAGRDVRPVSDVQVMLAQVRGPLLGALRRSPEFRPAYDPLLRMALQLAQQDAGAARELLSELVRLQPLRPEAGQALRTLPPAAP